MPKQSELKKKQTKLRFTMRVSIDQNVGVSIDTVIDAIEKLPCIIDVHEVNVYIL